MLNRRRARILRSLFAPDMQALTVSQLAAQHNVSERLIRYDLDAIGEWVRRRGGSVRMGSRGDLSVQGVPSRILAGLEVRDGTDLATDDYVHSPEERQHLIILALLKEEGALTVPVLANQLWVSRGTIYTDLENAERWLSQQGLALERQPHVGIRIKGSEFARRLAVAAILVERFGPENLFKWFVGRDGADAFAGSEPNLFDLADLRAAIQAIQRVEESQGLALADHSLSQLALYLAVSLSRLHAGYPVEPPPPIEGSLPQAWVGRVAQALWDELTPDLPGGLPAAERAALTLVLQQAGARFEGSIPHSTISPVDIQLATEFVAQVESLLGVELRRDDELIPCLALHLRPLPHRLEQGLWTANPLLNRIKETLPNLYRAADVASEILAQAWGKEIPDAEIGYLTMHLGAALERIKSYTAPKPRVLVVCGSGVGTARLLASRLQVLLPEVELVRVTSVLALSATLNTSACDLVIATCPVPAIGVPVVQVSPLLLGKEAQAIRQALETGGFIDPLYGKGRQPMLTEILSPATIQLDSEAADWEEAVRAAGRLLVSTDAVDPAYVDAMVTAVRRVGPYIVIAPGIALPHARPEDGVHNMAISMLRLVKPVRFGHQTNDPVDLVFALAAVDVDSHLKALTQLSTLISSDDGVAMLRAAANPSEVMSILDNFITEGR